MISLNIKNRILLLIIIVNTTCFSACIENKTSNLNNHHTEVINEQPINNILVGANQTEKYLPLLYHKRIAVVANQTSVIFKNEQQTQYTHLVDSLLSLGINIKKVFAPEHGFRGTADAGELIKDGIDTKTGLPIISLYGNNKKPTKEQLENIDLIIFDIQDVGARFYTYISTLHYVMEACAEYNIEVLVLDRPNPNGHYIDGPILESEHQSFVGMHRVPVVHGMTIAEYAQMINGEGWLEKSIKAKLTIVKVANYERQLPYSLPIKPSPNLPNDTAINLYPSLCFFEGTNVNAGRGTTKQFQLFGSPFLDSAVFNFSYIPQPNEGAKNPKHNGVVCYGLDLSSQPPLNYLDLSFLIMAYQNTSEPAKFFNDFFTKLAGNTSLRQQIEKGMTPDDIKKTWEEGLSTFIKMRQPYLLYN
jgi:uncharacterized protein YbbC (DUF1343 family)